MRTFVRLRRMLDGNKQLREKIEALEQQYDEQFRVVFEAIQQLMTVEENQNKRPIGFAAWPKDSVATTET